MAEDTSTAAKIAAACLVMCVIVTMAVTLMWITKEFLNRQVHTYDMAISQAHDAQASFLGSYAKPVPVASVYKVIEAIDFDVHVDPYTGAKSSRIQSFKIFTEKLGVRGETVPISTNYADVAKFLDCKAYFGWSLNDSTGQYEAEMVLYDMEHDEAVGRL